MTRFRTMEWDDISSGLSLCRSAGWNQLSRDWELFLALNKEGCKVCVDENGKVIGTVTTIDYENHFGWIGMVLVDPLQQRKGIGLRLLKESIEILKSQRTIKLDATPAGRNVYLKLDFVDEYPLSRMVAKISRTHERPVSAARPMTSNDLTSLALLDEQVFGASRTPVLKWTFEGASHLAFVFEDKDQLRGYCFGRSGYNFTHIGPVVAEDAHVAATLITAVLRNCFDQSVALDVLHHSPEWLNRLSGIGFKEQRAFIRMYRGVNAWPGIPGKQFAIMGPEFG